MNTTTHTYAHATGELTTLALQELENFVTTANRIPVRQRVLASAAIERIR